MRALSEIPFYCDIYIWNDVFVESSKFYIFLIHLVHVTDGFTQ